MKEFLSGDWAAMVLFFITNLHVRGQSRYHPVKKIRLEAAPGTVNTSVTLLSMRLDFN